MLVLRLLAVVLMVGFVTDQFPYGTVTFGYDGFAVDTVHYFHAEGDYVLYRVFYDEGSSEEIIEKGVLICQICQKWENMPPMMMEITLPEELQGRPVQSLQDGDNRP